MLRASTHQQQHHSITTMSTASTTTILSAPCFTSPQLYANIKMDTKAFS